MYFGSLKSCKLGVNETASDRAILSFSGCRHISYKHSRTFGKDCAWNFG